MNKKEAAAFLNVSEKTIDRLVKGGKLSARMEKGKTRDIVILDDQELAAYKEQRDQPRHLPAVVKSEAAPVQILPQQSLDNLDIGNWTGSISHLAESINSLSQLAEKYLADTQRNDDKSERLLSISEAVNYSRLSRKLIEAAVRNKELKTFQGHRGLKLIKKADLDRFIDQLS